MNVAAPRTQDIKTFCKQFSNCSFGVPHLLAHCMCCSIEEMTSFSAIDFPEMILHYNNGVCLIVNYLCVEFTRTVLPCVLDEVFMLLVIYC